MKNHHVSQRLRLSTSWWVASEFIRRHPRLSLVETHPAGGTYDMLEVREPRSQPGSRILALNRISDGTIHVRDASQGLLSWGEVIAFEDPHEVVRVLEQAAGIQPPSSTPPTTRVSLTYRVISRLMDTLHHDKALWDVRNARVDSSGEYSGPDPRPLRNFPLAEAAAKPQPGDFFHDPHYRFWFILQDQQRRAVVDTDARLYTRDSTFDLMKSYASSGRSLTSVTAKVIGRVQ